MKPALPHTEGGKRRFGRVGRGGCLPIASRTGPASIVVFSSARADRFRRCRLCSLEPCRRRWRWRARAPASTVSAWARSSTWSVGNRASRPRLGARNEKGGYRASPAASDVLRGPAATSSQAEQQWRRPLPPALDEREHRCASWFLARYGDRLSDAVAVGLEAGTAASGAGRGSREVRLRPNERRLTPVVMSSARAGFLPCADARRIIAHGGPMSPRRPAPPPLPLTDEHGPGAMHTMKQIKRALDPHGLMNPGKVLEHRRDPETGRLVLCG